MTTPPDAMPTDVPAHAARPSPAGGGLFGRLSSLLSGSGGRKRVAAEAYARLVEQARAPAFFGPEAGGVPDTLDGRFDMIVLHLVLVFRRLRGEGAQSDRFAQDVFDALFTDMDRNLREMGVGDLSVAKRIKNMARAFYGRLSAYDRAFDTAQTVGDLDPLANVLRNNVVGHEASDAQVDALARYVLAQLGVFANQPTEEILRANLAFTTLEQADRADNGPTA